MSAFARKKLNASRNSELFRCSFCFCRYLVGHFNRCVFNGIDLFICNLQKVKERILSLCSSGSKEEKDSSRLACQHFDLIITLNNCVPFLCLGQVFSQNLAHVRDQAKTGEGSPDDDDSYLGYSVATGEFDGDQSSADTAVGMPRGADLRVREHSTQPVLRKFVTSVPFFSSGKSSDLRLQADEPAQPDWRPGRGVLRLLHRLWRLQRRRVGRSRDWLANVDGLLQGADWKVRDRKSVCRLPG